MTLKSKKIQGHDPLLSLNVHPVAQFGWEMLNAQTKRALAKKIANKDVRATQSPGISLAVMDGIVLVLKEDFGMSTLVSVLTEREVSVFCPHLLPLFARQPNHPS